MTVTREEWLAAAKLAKLDLSAERLDALMTEMQPLMAYADTVRNTAAIPLPVDRRAAAVLRDDAVYPSVDRAAALGDRDSEQTGFFVTGEASPKGGC